MPRPGEEVRIEFSALHSDVTLHEPVFVDFSIHNELNEVVRFDLGHNRKSNLKIMITEPDGSIMVVPQLSDEGFGRIGEMTLEPAKSYHQRLLVNEWYHFAQPGDYRVDVKLVDPVQTQAGTPIVPSSSGPLSIKIHPRDPDRLDQICNALARTAIGSSHVEEATAAALALSYIRDPIAIPYLEQALNRNLVQSYAIHGLGRIASERAVDLLISTANQVDREAAALARSTLYKILYKVKNSRQKKQIKALLRS